MSTRATWLLLAIALLCAPAAHAGRRCWEDFERAYYVAYVVPETKPKPGVWNPRTPHLSRAFAFHCFMFPYSVTDLGYVLTTNDRHGPWQPVSAAQVAELQRAERLPNPLPAFELAWSDWLMGHALWLLPVISGLGAVIGRMLVRRRGVRMHA